MAGSLEIRPFIPTTEAFKGREKIYTLDHIPRMQHILADLSSDTVGGEPFRAKLREAGSFLAKAYSIIETGTSSGAFIRTVYPTPLIMGIPRGGNPLAEGVRSEFPNSTYLLTNAGDKQRPDEPLLPDNFPSGSPILLVDTVIGSGETMMRHLDALEKKTPNIPVFLLSALALLDYQGFGLSRLFSNYPNLTAIICRLETKAEWKERKEGKHLYVHGIGSVGDLVSVT